jgi:hypothetical protein
MKKKNQEGTIDLVLVIDIEIEIIQVIEVTIGNIQVMEITIESIQVIEIIEMKDIETIQVIDIENIQVIVIAEILEKGEGGILLNVVKKDIGLHHVKDADIHLKVDLVKGVDILRKTDLMKGVDILEHQKIDTEEILRQKGGIEKTLQKETKRKLKNQR